MAVNRSREAWKVYNNVFDAFTLRVIEKLRSQGHFDDLKSALAMGKEANVFTTIAKEPRIVKIYRLETRDFNGMLSYLVQDPRYFDIKKRKREIVFAWSQREYRNLLIARQAVPVPKPITYYKNVLVMSQIGDTKPANKLKDTALKNPKIVFDKIIFGMKNLWNIGLVHGDLSEFNILMNDEIPVFIDFSQSSLTSAPNAKELWDRDVKNVIRAASKHDLLLTDKDFIL